jgi:hypothetical protein
MRSCNEMRSPYGRDLPTLLESDLENVPGIDSDADAVSKNGVYNNAQNKLFFHSIATTYYCCHYRNQRRIQGGAHPAPSTILIFHTKYTKNFQYTMI